MGKNEFHVHFWGGVKNDGLAERFLGTSETDFWFDSREERRKFMYRLEALAVKNDTIVVFNETEAPICFTRTIAHLVFAYDGRQWAFEIDFGVGYEEESVHYLFNDGNYSCDCNRSALIHGCHPDFPQERFEDDCSEIIQLIDLQIEHRSALARRMAEQESAELSAATKPAQAAASKGGRL